MANSKWLEVSLFVDGELAEAVSEVFGRFAPNGVAIEASHEGGLQAESTEMESGQVKVSVYLRDDEELETTRTKLMESLWYLSRIRDIPSPQFRMVNEENWSSAWKKHYHPIPIGRKLIVVPAWMQPYETKRIPIYIDPGMAFGTGTHPTTQLCLYVVEEVFSQPGEVDQLHFLSDYLNGHLDIFQNSDGIGLIDLGCGSGILSIGAAKLGVKHALCVDIDDIAVQATVENIETNAVSDQLEVGLGSLKDIQAGVFSIKQSELVLANILASELIRLLDEGLSELVAPHGLLVLSGIIDEQIGDVESAVQRNALTKVGYKNMGDWVVMCLTH